MNRILIICPSMYPRMRFWGETQRMFYLANHLVKNGNYVITLSNNHPIRDEGREVLYDSVFIGEEKRNELNIKRIKRGKYLFDMGKEIIYSMYQDWNLVADFRFECSIWMYISEIKKIINEKNITIVLISVPLFSEMRLGRLIKRLFPNIKILIDYRDPWYLWKRKKSLAYFREKFFLKSADAIVGFSDIFIDDMKRTFKLNKPTFCIYNGYSETDWVEFEKDNFSNNILERNKKIKIGYVGSVILDDKKNNYRNINNLLRVVSKYDNIEMYVVGKCEGTNEFQAENIHYIGDVSQKKSFEYMIGCDVLLCIHNTNDYSSRYLISGKLFDYMRSGIPIWLISRSDSLMSSIMEKYHLGFVSENDIESIEIMVSRLQSMHSKDELAKYRIKDEDYSFFSREYQNIKYENIINQIGGNKNG